MDTKIAAKVLAKALRDESNSRQGEGMASFSHTIRRMGGDHRFRQTLLNVLNDFAGSWEEFPGQGDRATGRCLEPANTTNRVSPLEEPDLAQQTPLTFRW